MKKGIFIIIYGWLMCFSTFAQETLADRVVELARIYKTYSYKGGPPSDVYIRLKKIKGSELGTTVEFIQQLVTVNNELLTKNYLQKPDSLSLKYIYAVKEVSEKLADESSKPLEYAQSLLGSNVSGYETLANYYDLLFSSVYVKNQPLNISKVNLQINKYNLRDDQQKGIFYLEAVTLCRRMLEDDIKAKKSDFTAGLYSFTKFPRFNGSDYYKYTDLSFEDFTLGKAGKSYKSQKLDQLYNVLLFQLDCYNSKNMGREREDLLATSILKEESYYHYSHLETHLRTVLSEAGSGENQSAGK